MILCVCTDDDRGTYDVARRSYEGRPRVFRSYYRAFRDVVPALAADEDLFIIAHGAKHGDGGVPVIGDRRKDFYVNAAELWLNCEGMFPRDYRGNIYVSACETADPAPEFSFVEVLKARVQAARPAVKHVYGQRGVVKGDIPLPGNPQWVEAA